MVEIHHLCHLIKAVAGFYETYILSLHHIFHKSKIEYLLNIEECHFQDPSNKPEIESL
jgi:hypothetical protein